MGKLTPPACLSGQSLSSPLDCIEYLFNQRGFNFYRGRVALSKLLTAVGVKSGDGVAVQAFTCRAITDGIASIGARARFIDISSLGVNIDPLKLEEALADNIKAVVIQHTFGIPAEIEKICEICASRGIPVLEDCCHSIFSTFNNRLIGTFGSGSIYSFEWGKPVIAGLGGIGTGLTDGCFEALKSLSLNTSQAPIIKQLKIFIQLLAYRTLFTPSRYWKLKKLFNLLAKTPLIEGSYTSEDQQANPEYLWKMPVATKALLGRELISHFKDLERRKTLVEKYQSALTHSNLVHVQIHPKAKPVFLRYPIYIDDKDDLLKRAAESGIEIAGWFTTPVHPLVNKQLDHVNYQVKQCPNAESACSHLVTLPLHPAINSRTSDKIINFITNSCQ